MLTAAPGVYGKDVDGEFAVFSVGGKSCADYLRARSGGGRTQHDFTTWMQGYLSAFNLIVPNTYDILGRVVSSLTAGCVDVPRDGGSTATGAGAEPAASSISTSRCFTSRRC